MKILKKILIISMVTAMMIVTLADCSKKAVSASSDPGKPVKVAVFLIDFTDPYILWRKVRWSYTKWRDWQSPQRRHWSYIIKSNFL